jgi:hypothetical protein
MLIKTNTSIPLELRITDYGSQIRTDITSVYFRVYHRVAGVIVEDVVSTLMNGSSSFWYYSITGGLTTAGEYIIEYTITDSDAEVYLQTEELTIGYMQSDIQSIAVDVSLIKNIESGRWKIEGNQMKFYDNNDSVILTFNLKDASGNPSSDAVFERVPV